MKAVAEGTLSAPDTTTDFRGIDSAASYLDIVTISFAPFAGQVGYVLPIFDVTGSTAGGAIAVVQVFSQDSVGTLPEEEQTMYASGTQYSISPQSSLLTAIHFFSELRLTQMRWGLRTGGRKHRVSQTSAIRQCCPV